MPDPTPPDRDPIVLAIGGALQAFAGVEFGLAALFDVAVDTHLGITILDAARGFEIRLRIIEAVAERTLRADHLKRAKNLFNQTRRRADFRNKLAHWQISTWPVTVNGVPPKNWGWMLMPPVHGLRYGELMNDSNSNGDKPISKQQIDDFTARCLKLTDELFALYSEIRTAKRSGQYPA